MSVLLWSTLLIPLGDKSPHERIAEQMCGLQCAYLSLLSIGIEPGSYTSFIKEFGDPDASGGYSVGRIASVLEGRGAKCLACKSDLATIRPMLTKGTAIVHLRRAHFVVLKSVTDEEVEYLDQATVVTIPRKTFELQLTGVFLVVSLDPIEIPKASLVWFVAVPLAVSGIVVLFMVVRHWAVSRI